MILILLPWFLLKADGHYSKPTQQNVNQTTIVKKKTLPASGEYLGVRITAQDERDYLELEFTNMGLVDQIPMAEAVVACESGYNIYANNGISYGIAQFTPVTWKDFGHGDIFNPLTQLETMARMWKNPLLRLRWDCYRKLK